MAPRDAEMRIWERSPLQRGFSKAEEEVEGARQDMRRRAAETRGDDRVKGNECRRMRRKSPGVEVNERDEKVKRFSSSGVSERG